MNKIIVSDNLYKVIVERLNSPPQPNEYLEKLMNFIAPWEKIVRTEFFVSYGCYLGKVAQRVAVEHHENVSIEAVNEWLYDQFWEDAVDETSNWYGLHGFELDEEADEEDVNQYISENAETVVALWDQEKHEGEFSAPDYVEDILVLEYVGP